MARSTLCIDCGQAKELSRQRSFRCRTCEKARRQAWLAEAPRCPHCGQVLPPEMRGEPSKGGLAAQARASGRARARQELEEEARRALRPVDPPSGPRGL